MRTGNYYRVLRWMVGAHAVLISIVILVLTARFVPAYVLDRSLSNKAGYLGTILGAVSFLVVLIQFLRGLGRRERPQRRSGAGCPASSRPSSMCPALRLAS